MKHRRDFLKSALATLPAAAWAKSNEVRLGAQSYSFRDRDLDGAIAGYQAAGLKYVELFSGHIEPTGTSAKPVTREELRQWRLETPLKHFEDVAAKIKAGGLTLVAYNYSFREDFTDAEIARGFDIAKALGVQWITASSNVTTAKRIDPFARKAKVKVGMHNHSRIAPNEFATPQNFADAMAGTSEYICINLDIGHFCAANFDPVEFLDKHHERILTLHTKDRKRDQGDNVPFGQGDTPIRAVLQLLKTKGYDNPPMIEYEYKGADTVAEVKKCADFCRAALA
ncbi:sugar phosphate isomerase/epimerase [uncultured Paludibaculum sp.]|uniref:sugar phosphate isomerase/epimerase family protein n=1 Tax=uncultured Paludibaculum sp. TaxID=1765020 RepID=UPI002AAAFF2B|nr:sugar phosphate isomerase/epimerase [uncultured Paludibaculum sp.]